ncbi:GNAT family N-acetyltransferase [Neptuniibacter marinus]|uniref:GNAT family N-acetyltransferase n=1 Tax=Neptuniibacter marinus TaxID=1806670 RepID=UPI00082CCE30|nr:GNAT family N-acetyltransferase [Neptuniibacter marinus]
MRIRAYRPSDSVEITNLFHTSVHTIKQSFYSKEEREAWAPTPPDYTGWKARLLIKKPFVALKKNRIIGFIELESDGHIDCLYVHPDYQGSGVARQLLQHILIVAQKKGITRLHVEASKVAMPFFKKSGFKLIKENHINLRGQSLLNYSMSWSIQP